MQQEINTVIKILEEGGIILYPTDTIWGIGCDATNEAAVKKVYELKQRLDSKALICLVANDFMLEQHITTVPDVAYDIIDLAIKPTTIVYDAPKKVAKNLIANDNSLAIRVVTDDFCKRLITKFRKPLVSTSANISGQANPNSFSEIAPEILKGVDYVVNLHRDKKNSSPSAIIKLTNNGTVTVIRK